MPPDSDPIGPLLLSCPRVEPLPPPIATARDGAGTRHAAPMDQFTTRQLTALGMTERQIRAAVDRGELVRTRRGHFARAGIGELAIAGARGGGALACVSELRHRGIWVQDSGVVHIRVARTASRLPAIGPGIRRHWDALPLAGDDVHHVGLVSALIQAFGCLDHRAWIASADSAAHLGLLHPEDLALLRAGLPRAGRLALYLLDRRAESGLESIVRVIARELGFRVRSQVVIRGVGRVDLVVEGWIVVETDGTAFHDQALSAKDRLRDARLVERGRSVLRPGYSLVIFDQATVARQLIGAVAAHRRVANSGRIVARARRRAAALDFS